MVAPTPEAKNAKTGYPQTGFRVEAVGEREQLRQARGPAMWRTLHVVDLDNLLGFPWHSAAWPLWPRAAAVRATLDAYRLAAVVRPGDHELVLATGRLAVEAKLAAPGSRVVLRRGPLVLSLPVDLTPQHCAARYGRVVLGSGDGSAAAFLDHLVRQGMAIRVVARRERLAMALARTDSVVAALHGAARPWRGGA